MERSERKYRIVAKNPPNCQWVERDGQAYCIPAKSCRPTQKGHCHARKSSKSQTIPQSRLSMWLNTGEWELERPVHLHNKRYVQLPAEHFFEHIEEDICGPGEAPHNAELAHYLKLASSAPEVAKMSERQLEQWNRRDLIELARRTAECKGRAQPSGYHYTPFAKPRPTAYSGAGVGSVEEPWTPPLPPSKPASSYRGAGAG